MLSSISNSLPKEMSYNLCLQLLNDKLFSKSFVAIHQKITIKYWLLE